MGKEPERSVLRLACISILWPKWPSTLQALAGLRYESVKQQDYGTENRAYNNEVGYVGVSKRGRCKETSAKSVSSAKSDLFA